MWTLACMVLAVGAFAQESGVDGLSPEQAARTARLQSIEADRAGAAEQLVSRWQGANAALGSRWEAELRQVASKASPERLLAASEASTYQGVVDALVNGGRRLALPGEKDLGDTNSDLVYFPVTPCRIVDTRFATGGYAGRIVAGVTFPAPGNWMSWPPHEHSAMLEEAYLYIDMPAPSFGIQLVYTEPQAPELAVVVREGDVVLMPAGYHPGVGAPGGSINFLWMMAAHREGVDRQFGVVNVQPEFAAGGSGLDPGRAK